MCGLVWGGGLPSGLRGSRLSGEASHRVNKYIGIVERAASLSSVSRTAAAGQRASLVVQWLQRSSRERWDPASIPGGRDFSRSGFGPKVANEIGQDAGVGGAGGREAAGGRGGHGLGAGTLISGPGCLVCLFFFLGERSLPLKHIEIFKYALPPGVGPPFCSGKLPYGQTASRLDGGVPM